MLVYAYGIENHITALNKHNIWVCRIWMAKLCTFITQLENVPPTKPLASEEGPPVNALSLEGILTQANWPVLWSLHPQRLTSNVHLPDEECSEYDF